MKRRILVVFGTRPEAIKLAPVIQELSGHPEDIEPIVVVTAQHREMLDQVLECFGIVPDIDLSLMKPGQTLFDITEGVLRGMESLLAQIEPDLVLVQGDTTTVFSASLAAFYRKIPVGHVEAGLRTHCRYNPFPEEMNRVLTSRLATVHFAPTERARANLIEEGVPRDQVILTGNTVVDALLRMVRPDYVYKETRLREIDFQTRRLALLTTHRRESWGAAMRESLRAIREVTDQIPDLLTVFPVHLSPSVREVTREILAGAERFLLLEPLDYLDFIHLMARSWIVFTDSGGVQEEAPSFRVPVLVLRDTTERPEGIEAGVARLVGTNRERIFGEAMRIFSSTEEHRQMARANNPYGDGKAAQRIVEWIRGWTPERISTR